MRDEMRDIEREIRSWTARPPARPPRVARTRVLARIEGRRSGRAWRLAATAVALVVAFASWRLLSRPETAMAPPAVTLAKQTQPQRPPARLLVYELESGTKLYLALAAPPVKMPNPRNTSTLEGNG